MKNLTLLYDKHLSNIASVLGISIEDTEEMILKKLDLLDSTFDDECNAGANVVMVMDDTDCDVEAFMQTLIPESAYDDFMALTFWGIDGECEKCGCHMEEIEACLDDDLSLVGVYRCVNCNAYSTQIIG